MTKLFAILNLTPDSFSDGGLYMEADQALERAKNLIESGADYIDVGAESTRPGATPVEADNEWGRLDLVIGPLIERYPGQVSLDTRNAETAHRFLSRGGTIINDVSGLQDPRMQEVILQHQAQIIINHFPGKTISEVHDQQIDSVDQVEDELMTTYEILTKSGLSPNKIVLDPGIGFGKTMEINRQLLTFADRMPEIRVMIGHSKKRLLGQNRHEKLPNQTAGEIAAKSGAWALRVHDPQWYS